MVVVPRKLYNHVELKVGLGLKALKDNEGNAQPLCGSGTSIVFSHPIMQCQVLRTTNLAPHVTKSTPNNAQTSNRV